MNEWKLSRICSFGTLLYTHDFSLGLRILVLKQWVYLVEMHEIGKKYFENLKFNESQQNNKTEIALLFWKSGFLSDI